MARPSDREIIDAARKAVRYWAGAQLHRELVASSYLSWDDYQQEVALGVVVAADHYDPAHPLRKTFTAYGGFVGCRRASDLAAKASRTVGLKPHLIWQSAARDRRRERSRTTAKRCRAQRPVLISDDSDDLGAVSVTCEQDPDTVEERTRLRLVMQRLTQRSRKVLGLRYGICDKHLECSCRDEDGMTLDDLGKVYGVSREWARVMVGRALDELRAKLRAEREEHCR